MRGCGISSTSLVYHLQGRSEDEECHKNYFLFIIIQIFLILFNYHTKSIWLNTMLWWKGILDLISTPLIEMFTKSLVWKKFQKCSFLQLPLIRFRWRPVSVWSAKIEIIFAMCLYYCLFNVVWLNIFDPAALHIP